MKAVKANLRFDSVTVGGKGSGFDNNLVALFRRTIKRNHHEVKVRGKRIHHDDFCWIGADNASHVLGQKAVIRHPGMTSVEMGLYAELRPVLQLLLDIFARGLR